MTWKRKAFLQRLWEAALVAVLLLPFRLTAQKAHSLSFASPPLFSLDLPQETPEGGQPRAEAMREGPVSVCSTPPDNDQKIKQTVIGGRLIHKVQPKYPKAARKAHIEGTVVLCAVIGKDGKIMNLRAASGPKELIAAAMTAVQKWVYKPYMLDGEPIDVETDIHVNFKLD